jgi:undecaprenyl-diphosphatase
MIFNVDQNILNFIVQHRTSALTPIMIFFTNIGSGKVVTIGLVVAIVIFYFLKRYYPALILFISVISGQIIVYLTKILIERPRPPVVFALTHETSFSFPSGHSFTAISFYGLLFYFIYMFIKNRYLKSLVLIIGIIIVLFIGISRIYLGVHWFTDVLGSFIFATIWTRVLLNFFKNRLE